MGLQGRQVRDRRLTQNYTRSVSVSQVSSCQVCSVQPEVFYTCTQWNMS